MFKILSFESTRHTALEAIRDSTSKADIVLRSTPRMRVVSHTTNIVEQKYLAAATEFMAVIILIVEDN